jgi:hypothetical protein
MYIDGWEWEKVAQKVHSPMHFLSKPTHNLYHGKISPKFRDTSLIKKLPKVNNRPICWRKFVQSGHPDHKRYHFWPSYLHIYIFAQKAISNPGTKLHTLLCMYFCDKTELPGRGRFLKSSVPELAKPDLS